MDKLWQNTMGNLSLGQWQKYTENFRIKTDIVTIIRFRETQNILSPFTVALKMDETLSFETVVMQGNTTQCHNNKKINHKVSSFYVCVIV